MELQFDGAIDIAQGKHRHDLSWQNKNVLWSKLVQRFSQTTRTSETLAEYMGFKRTVQDEKKDVGGFVGGYLTAGRRKNGNVQHRQLLTLDIDHGSGDIWALFKSKFNCAAAIYSTHKHTPEAPRLRLVIPLDREVFSDEYTPIGRRVAGDIGIDIFDTTTFQPARLMYWPSTSSDAEFFFDYQDGPWLSADEVLGQYHNWRDISEWPVSARHREELVRGTKKQGDPLTKPGLIGAFCREYSISEAIEAFLREAYEECDTPDRYTYREGSTAAGLVVYDDKFAYSHHGTDPAGGKLCNAFDLVRLHLFGLQDEDAGADTPGNKLPSFTAMTEFCMQDEGVRGRRVNEKIEAAAEAFKDVPGSSAAGPGETQDEWGPVQVYAGKPPEPANTDWQKQLDIDKKGNILSTIDNIVVIMENDPALAGALAWDEFECRPIACRRLPWRPVHGAADKYLRDTDDANLAHYLEKVYGIGSAKIEKAMGVIYERHRVHPVREYLSGLTWDGVPRLDRLLIDYLGAVQSDYVVEVTRKTMVAAVARIMTPGCKFDYMLTLVGEQGDKKSTLFDRLGGRWFSDSFTTVQGKEAVEQLQGAWVIEIAELAAFRRAEVESVKHFVSKRIDRFRAAYGRRTETHARQCIFVGTTNRPEFLKDVTGNRRFWPVTVNGLNRVKDPDTLGPSEVAQIWAEAVMRYECGELLYLNDEMEQQAKAIQEQHTEEDDRTGIICKYLDTLLPEGWEDMDVWARREWLAGGEDRVPGTRQRTRVTVSELWIEALGMQAKDMTRFNTAPIHDIMTRLKGWERHHSKIYVPGAPQRGYHRKGVIVYSHVPEIYRF